MVPDLAFEHDLKYPDALKIIESLQTASQKTGFQFGVKLTNTLESINNKEIFNAKEKMMYMSGRALHPISINWHANCRMIWTGSLISPFRPGLTASILPMFLPAE